MFYLFLAVTLQWPSAFDTLARLFVETAQKSAPEVLCWDLFLLVLVLLVHVLGARVGL